MSDSNFLTGTMSDEQYDSPYCANNQTDYNNETLKDLIFGQEQCSWKDQPTYVGSLLHFVRAALVACILLSAQSALILLTAL